MLITPELLYAFNGIHVADEGAARELLEVQIGTAQQIVSDYVGFNAEDVLLPCLRYTEAEKSLFKTVCLRIATLLQLEGGGNIGVNTAASDMSASRSYLNVTDYTPYLKPLSAFRHTGGIW